MRREAALLGGPFDGERHEVDDEDAYLIMPPKHRDGDAAVYRRILEVDGDGRPVFAIDGFSV